MNSTDMRKPTPGHCHETNNYAANCQAVDVNGTNESSVDNAMSQQESVTCTVFLQESKSCYNVVGFDDDMLMVNNMDTNSIQNDLSQELQLLQNRKRAAIEHDAEINNFNIVEKVLQISMENGDGSQPQQPGMRTNPYNSCGMI